MSNQTYRGAAGKFFANMGPGWNLGNALDATSPKLLEGPGTPESYETAWHNPVITRELIRTVREAGFGTIRVPVTWMNHIGPAPDYHVRDAWMDRVQEVVDMVLDEGLHCILNVHHDTGTHGWLHASERHVAEVSDKFVALWRQIATRFRDYGERLAFEGFNEVLDEHNNWVYPGTRSAAEAINHFNRLFVETVRGTGGPNAGRCLIITAYGATNLRSALEDLVMPEDSAEDARLLQVHYYSPISYCFDEKDGENAQRAWRENGGREALEEVMDNVSELFTSRGIPVLMAEYAASHKGNEADRAEWARFVVESCARHGVNCIWWDNGGRVTSAAAYSTMGLLDRYRLEWMFPRVVEALTGVRPEKVSAS